MAPEIFAAFRADLSPKLYAFICLIILVHLSRHGIDAITSNDNVTDDQSITTETTPPPQQQHQLLLHHADGESSSSSFAHPPHSSSATWNFSKWWHERNENTQLYSEPVIFDEPAKSGQQYGDFDRFGTVQYNKPSTFNADHLDGVLVTSHMFEFDRHFAPTSSVETINQTIRQYFATPRYSSDESRDYMRDLRETLKEKFLSYGLKTAFHVFRTEASPTKMSMLQGPVKSRKRQSATNIIAILPGKHRGTPDDEIYLIGAHYDTVRRSPGVDDNGSGSAAVMEMARLLTKHKCYFNKTIIFTLFDLEEEYLKGSKYFVQQYLIPTEVRKNRAQFKGAFIMDMLLAYNTTEGSQSLRDFWPTLPAFVEDVKESGARGNFLTAWSRRNIDHDLFFFLEKNWKNSHRYPLKLLDPPLPTYSHEVAKHWSKYSKYGTFARSDHASFWYPIEKNTTFQAILLSDLGPWRREMAFHYHRVGDDLRWLRRENIEFMKNTIDSVLATMLDVAQGRCFARK